MSDIEQTYNNLTHEMVHKSIFSDYNSRIIEILAERANLFDELEMTDDAQVDRLTMRHIQKHPDVSHHQKCCGRANDIELDVLRDRIRRHCQS